METSPDHTAAIGLQDGNRYVILRDIHSPTFAPWGVLFETPGGGARLYKFGTWDDRMREVYDDFDRALDTAARNWLVTAVGREGQEHPDA